MLSRVTKSRRRRRRLVVMMRVLVGWVLWGRVVDGAVSES